MKKWLFIVMAMMIAQSVLWPWMAYTSAVTITHDTSDLIHYWLDDGEDFYAWTITVKEWRNSITMLDRNLWATDTTAWCQNNIESCKEWREDLWYYSNKRYYQFSNFDECLTICTSSHYSDDCNNYCTADYQWYDSFDECYEALEESYQTCMGWIGYYFQWWNNYWIDLWWVAYYNHQLDDSVDVSDYWPDYWYSSSIFTRNYLGDDSIIHNLWWWVNDSYDNDYWYPITNAYDRQWPCPDGYHIPSYWERDELAALADDPSYKDDLLLPNTHNYRISSDEDHISRTDKWYMSDYLASSSVWSISSTITFARDWDARHNGYGAEIVMPIRCFKNPPVYASPRDSDWFQTTIWDTTQNGFPSTAIVTPNAVSQVAWEQLLGSINIDFWTSANVTFNQLLQVDIPVDDGYDKAIAMVKHGWSNEYNYDWLTTNPNASCSNWNVVWTSNRYKWKPITVNDGIVTIYTCAASSFIAVWENNPAAHIHVTVSGWLVTIGTNTGTVWTLNKNLGELNISNSVQTITGDFGDNSFWIEDMKWNESGYYTTLSVSDMIWESNSWHIIPRANIQLKPTGVSKISWANVLESKVILWDSWNDWTNYTWTWNQTTVTYFNRQNTALADAGRVWKYWDNLQIKVTVPAHTVADTYRGTITYTLYEL
jgi:hypothetical protein